MISSFMFVKLMNYQIFVSHIAEVARMVLLFLVCSLTWWSVVICKANSNGNMSTEDPTPHHNGEEGMLSVTYDVI